MKNFWLVIIGGLEAVLGGDHVHALVAAALGGTPGLPLSDARCTVAL
jgi:hypothetical protein